jgi:bacterioferritin
MNKQKLIDKLNEDLSNELGAIIQYITYSAQVTGPYRPQLASFFLKEVPDEQGHAEFLANKVVALGGVPTTVPAPVATVETNKEMLQAALEAERKAVTGYKERAQQADEFGDVGLKVQLEDMVRDETEHQEQIERILRDWEVAVTA